MNPKLAIFLAVVALVFALQMIFDITYGYSGPTFFWRLFTSALIGFGVSAIWAQVAKVKARG